MSMVGLVALAACGGTAKPGPEPLVLERTIPLKGVKGRIDHLAVDLKHGRLSPSDAPSSGLAIVYRLPSRLAVLDAASGATRADLGTCGDADDVFFDPKRQRIYVSCGSGAVDVVQAQPSYASIGRIATRPGARTSLFVPELDRLFVAARADAPGGDAAILVYRPQP